MATICKHNSIWVVTSMHVQSKIHFLVDLLTPTFSRHNYRQHKLAKVGIQSCRFARELINVFHLCMHGCNYPAGIVFAQTQIVANAACRVGSQQFLS